MGQETHKSNFQTKPSGKGKYVFSFLDGDHAIEAQCSYWSGLETVYFNDREISRKRSFSVSTTHWFRHEGHEYEMVISMKAMLAGEVECWLLKEGALIGRQVRGLESLFDDTDRACGTPAAGQTI